MELKNAPIRFCGFSLHHNPHQLTIENTANVRELVTPCCQPDSVHLGLGLRRISGEGELYGADCLAQYHALEQLHRSQSLGKLILPHMVPLYAYLKELRMTAEAHDDVLRFRFVFTEACSPRKSRRSSEIYVTQEPDESLWDIAYHSGVPIERLTELNPQIAHIDRLVQGERVKLC